MTALDNYKLTFESLENEKIWRTKTGQRHFKADQGANARGLVRSLVSRLARNSKGTAKEGN